MRVIGRILRLLRKGRRNMVRKCFSVEFRDEDVLWNSYENNGWLTRTIFCCQEKISPAPSER